MPRKAKTPAKASNSIRSERKGAAASTVVSSDSIASDLAAFRKAGHQGTEDSLRSGWYHQEVEEAEGRRRASWRTDGSDLHRRRCHLRGQAAQLRAEGQS